MSGQLHYQLDASMKLFTGLTTLAASLGDRSDLRSGGIRRQGRDGRLGGRVISAAVDSFSSRIDCYQRRGDTSSPFTGDWQSGNKPRRPGLRPLNELTNN